MLTKPNDFRDVWPSDLRPLWAIFDRSGTSCLAVHVRSTPKADLEAAATLMSTRPSLVRLCFSICGTSNVFTKQYHLGKAAFTTTSEAHLSARQSGPRTKCEQDYLQIRL